MILNNASDIQSGAIPTDSVYHGNVLVWQRNSPVSPWDKYEKDHSNDIVLVRLDSSGKETDEIKVWNSSSTSYRNDAFYLALNWLRYQTGKLYNLYYGDNTYIPQKSYWEQYLAWYVDYQNIVMFRYPRTWTRNSDKIFGIYVNGSSKQFSNLKTIVLPETTVYSTGKIVLESSFAYKSGVENVVFRSDEIGGIGSAAFYNCSSLKQIEIPSTGADSIGNNAFYGCDGITITLNNAFGTVNGSPWGATNEIVLWNG